MSRLLFPLVPLFLVAIHAGCDRAELGSSDSDLRSNEAPPVACGAALPGEPLGSQLPEAQPGYAADLAAVDLSAVSDPYVYGDESPFARSVIDYMLGRPASELSHDEARRSGMGRAVLASASSGKLDLLFLRRGLYHHYPCSRPLPDDLTALRARYGEYTVWPMTKVACSRPKNGPRRLFENEELGVFIAETLVEEHVRETEVIFRDLRADGHLDFAVYTAEGALTDRSPFRNATTTSAAPYVCMACHYDATTSKFSLRFPRGTGAGCGP